MRTFVQYVDYSGRVICCQERENDCAVKCEEICVRCSKIGLKRCPRESEAKRQHAEERQRTMTLTSNLLLLLVAVAVFAYLCAGEWDFFFERFIDNLVTAASIALGFVAVHFASYFVSWLYEYEDAKYETKTSKPRKVFVVIVSVIVVALIAMLFKER